MKRRPSAVPRVMLSLALLTFGSCVAHDSVSATADQWSTRALVRSIESYRAVGSPKMRALGVQCRFRPTCSLYGLESVRKYGAMRGGWRTIRRIARCRASTPLGTFDPP